jgi:hypothetical protein
LRRQTLPTVGNQADYPTLLNIFDDGNELPRTYSRTKGNSVLHAPV